MSALSQQMRLVLQLVTSDFVGSFKPKISYKLAPTVLFGSFSTFFFLLLYIFILGLFRNPSYLPPDFNLFISIYFKELLLLQIVILGAWCVSTQKTNRDRLQEYKFLVGLPLHSEQIFVKFLVADCLRYLWIPTAFAVFYLGLLPFASIQFLARPILFSFVSYFFIQSLIVCSHLWIAPKSRTFRSYNYITKFNPIIIIFSSIVFGIAQPLFLFAAKDFTQLQFAMTSFIAFALSILLAWTARSLFLKLHESNFWFKNGEIEREKITERRSTKLFTTWTYRNVKNPFLFKNLILLFQSHSKLTNSGLTFAFFCVAYLLATNNLAYADRLTVLLAFTIIYILLYNIVTLNRLNQNEESSKILFSLPVTKSALYFSMLIPVSFWLITAISLLTFWLWLTGPELSNLLFFWLKSFIAIIVASVISLNSGLGNYPDINLAKNRYFFWLFLIMFISAVFYKFRILIALSISLLTFIELRKLRFYKGC